MMLKIIKCCHSSLMLKKASCLSKLKGSDESSYCPLRTRITHSHAHPTILNHL